VVKQVEIPVQRFFQRMAEIRGTGGATSETSYYSAMENLLNDLGTLLDPEVICNGQLKSTGAGHPDFGLYSKKQCSNGTPKPGQGEVPERGVIEVKPLGDNSWQTSQSKQATKYFNHYRLVLITNYREFRLIGEDESGKPIEREFFRLAADEASFWALAAHPQKSAKTHATHLGEFLRRVMMNAAPLTRPGDIAWFLASYARDALATLEEKDATALAPLRKALETTLGIKFEGDKGEHFFRSTLVQTLFYGVFSAWVIWAKAGGTGKFDWKSAAYIMTVPMIRTLFEEVAKPSRLAPLGLMDVLDRTGEALNRVDRTAFFKAFDSGEAVQHFYEPFLEAYDPELRKQMGVWYTPREIVRYMVERVDTVLRTEMGIADGLADKNVYVLDPCCGTGAYVVEVLRKIEETLRAKGEDALIGQDVQEAARERVFGFEIMSAPFVIAHWQVGNLLANLGAPVDAGKGERPAIYLTNALTGWEPPKGPKASLPLFPEMDQERDQAEHVKRDVPILVVIGNPPYNAFAGTSPEEEAGLVEPYKVGLRKKWKIGKWNLDDLYVRFFRIAERRIAQTGRGIVSYISNYSYTREPSFVVMREHLLQSFDKLWVENMHGDRNRTEYAPDGSTSETVFAMRGFSPGIRQGIVIGLAVKTGKPDEPKVIRYRDDIDAGRAEARRQSLLDSLGVTPFDDQYEVADPQPWNKLSFKPRDVTGNYLAWPKVPELAALEPNNGLMEKRGGALIDIDKDALTSRMQSYFNAAIDWKTLELTDPLLAKDASGHKAENARKAALAEEVYDAARVVRYISRPFDVRYAYYTNVSSIWNRARPELWAQFSGGNQFLLTRKKGDADPEGPPTNFTSCLADDHSMKTDAFVIPFLKHVPAQGMLAASASANLSTPARAWLTHIGLPDPDNDAATAAAPWHHALAITYAPQYLGDNADGIAVDWPRIPLPETRPIFDASVALGAQVAALLDTEVAVPGVTSGTIENHLRVMGGISSTDLAVKAGWGSKDTKGRVNPGTGKTETRDWTDAEKDALRIGFAAKGMEEAYGFALLGRAVDVYLNDTTFWRGVPESTWDYVIGGYLVIKKWLSYREESILGRPLSKDEAREVTSMVRRLTSLILLGGHLNANYVACRDTAYAWGVCSEEVCAPG
jgi:hypothetical protein